MDFAAGPLPVWSLTCRPFPPRRRRHLALSTNNIEKISSLSGLDNLQILSLGRNQIKKIEGLDGVADTLEELWMSYNLIDKLTVRPWDV